MSGWGEDEAGVWQNFTFKGLDHSVRWIDAKHLSTGFHISQQPVSKDLYEAATGQQYPDRLTVENAKIFIQMLSKDLNGYLRSQFDKYDVNRTDTWGRKSFFRPEEIRLPTREELRVAILTSISDFFLETVENPEKLPFKGSLEQGILTSHPYMQTVADIIRGTRSDTRTLDQVLGSNGPENALLRELSTLELFPQRAAIMDIISQNEATDEMDDDQIIQGFRIRTS